MQPRLGGVTGVHVNNISEGVVIVILQGGVGRTNSNSGGARVVRRTAVDASFAPPVLSIAADWCRLEAASVTAVTEK